MKHCTPSAHVALSIACLVGLLISPARATVPVCANFNNLQLNGWGPASDFPNILVSIPSGGGPGGASDPYLLVKDQQGASLLDAGPLFKGNWNDLQCGQLCFDMKIFNDGWPNSLSIAPYFIVRNANAGRRAQWVANTTITEPGGANPGWHHFCAQLGPVCDGQLPSNSQGYWQVLDGWPNSDFATVMSNVTNVYFPADYGPYPNEETGYDNLCLSSAPCSCDCFAFSCLRFWRETILCKPGPGGQYTYSFMMNNFTKQAVGSVVITPPGGITISPSTIAGPFPNGSNKAVSIIISGGSPGQKVCFRFTAYNTSGGIICCSEQCITLPQCGCIQVSSDQMGCTSTTNGQPVYTFTMDNLSAGTVTDFFIIPTPSNVGVTPQWFHYNSPVPLYGTFGANTIQFTGVSPGQAVCLHIVCINNTPGGGGVCCSIDKCVTMPYCIYSPCCPGDCCPPRVQLISQVIAEMDGVTLSLESKTVTGFLGDAAWIEETDRSSGLLLFLNNQTPLQPGDVVDVSGETSTLGLTRALLVQSLHKVDSPVQPAPLRPLMMTNQAIGGGNPNDFTFGVTGGIGLFNVGLLVQACGRVTTIGSDYFYMDDGSLPGDPTGNVGVRVFTEGLTNPTIGEFVRVTGLVVAAEYEPTGDSIRVLVPRTQADIGGHVADGPLLTRHLAADQFTKIR